MSLEWIRLGKGMNAMFGRLGMQELILILALVLLIFGPKRLPEIGRSIGKGLKEFRGATKDFQKNLDGSMHEEEDKEEVQQEQEKDDDEEV